MPAVITRDAADAGEPMVYQLGARESWTLLAASCVYDGSALNSTFIPALRTYTQGHLPMFTFGLDLLVAMHGSPYVSFAPQVRPATPGVASAVSALQTGLPQLEFLPGMLIAFGGFAPGGGFSDPAVSLNSLVLYVEGSHVGEGLDNLGPFMLVPGPGA